MELVRMKVGMVNIVSSEDTSTKLCTECIAVKDAIACRTITDAHEIVTGNSTCRNKEGKPIIWTRVD